MIRLASLADLPTLRDIERAAGAPFRDLGMAAIADDDPPTVAELTAFQQDGRAWVWVEHGVPVAYLLAAVVDGNAHIEQVSVHPRHFGRRIGRALIDDLDGWAGERGLAGLTLTTFAEVPWNAPYYTRLGFRVLAGHELTAGLRAVRAHEAARGLDSWPRVAMARGLQRNRHG